MMSKIDMIDEEGRVWFCLLNEDLSAYHNTHVQSVVLPDDVIVDDFKKEIKKGPNAEILLGIVPAQLTVFENKETAKDEEHAIKSSDLLEGYGVDEEDPVVVIVPSIKKGT